jgi:hypothetical protein
MAPLPPPSTSNLHAEDVCRGHFRSRKRFPCFRSHLPSTSCARSCSPFLPARPQAWASQRWRSPSFSRSGVPRDLGGKLEIGDLWPRKQSIDRVLFVHNALGNFEACHAYSPVRKPDPFGCSDSAAVNSQPTAANGRTKSDVPPAGDGSRSESLRSARRRNRRSRRECKSVPKMRAKYSRQ